MRMSSISLERKEILLLENEVDKAQFLSELLQNLVKA